VLLVADFGVRLTVWSLVDRRCSYLPGPKATSRGLAFSPCGNTLAVLQARGARAHVCMCVRAGARETLRPAAMRAAAPALRMRML
jgi:hypothetical protein